MQRGTTRSFRSPVGRSGFGLAVVLAVAGATGCVANGGDEGIIVLKNVLPGANCTVNPSVTETAIVQGALDVQLGGGYLFFAQLKSRITAGTGQEDARRIITRGANVDISFSDPNFFTADELKALDTKHLLHFMSPFSIDVAPNGGLADVPFLLIPPELTVAIAAKTFTSVVAQTTFKVVGSLAGGDVTSQAYPYSVTIFAKGLLHNAGNCSDLATSFVPRVANSCNPGQDGLVDCCADSGGLMCPAVGTKM
jgi:hypothetical protein